MTCAKNLAHFKFCIPAEQLDQKVAEKIEEKAAGSFKLAPGQGTAIVTGAISLILGVTSFAFRLKNMIVMHRASLRWCIKASDLATNGEAQLKVYSRVKNALQPSCNKAQESYILHRCLNQPGCCPGTLELTAGCFTLLAATMPSAWGHASMTSS